jgi:hypothetical protein
LIPECDEEDSDKDSEEESKPKFNKSDFRLRKGANVHVYRFITKKERLKN